MCSPLHGHPAVRFLPAAKLPLALLLLLIACRVGRSSVAESGEEPEQTANGKAGETGNDDSDEQNAEPLFPFVRNAWGFMNRSGKVVIPEQFHWAGEFSDGMGPVRKHFANGYANRAGEFIEIPQATRVLPFSEGRGWFLKDEKKWGCVDRSGRVVIEPSFDDVQPFAEGLAAVNMGAEPDRDDWTWMTGGKWGFVGLNGDQLVPFRYESVESYSEGLATVWRASGPRFIDRRGERVVFDAGVLGVPGPGKFSGSFRTFSEGLSVVAFSGEQGPEFGVIDRQGRAAIPRRRGQASRFSEGLAAFRTKEKWGYMDRTGRVVIEDRFDEAGDFSSGLALVKLGEEFKYIDQEGRAAIPRTQHDGARTEDAAAAIPGPINDARDFRNGLARVHIGGNLVETSHEQWWENGVWYYINTRGELVNRYKADGN